MSRSRTAGFVPRIQNPCYFGQLHASQTNRFLLRPWPAQSPHGSSATRPPLLSLPLYRSFRPVFSSKAVRSAWASNSNTWLVSWACCRASNASPAKQFERQPDTPTRAQVAHASLSASTSAPAAYKPGRCSCVAALLQFCACRVLSNPSLKWSANGRLPGPFCGAQHFPQPGPGSLPSSPT